METEKLKVARSHSDITSSDEENGKGACKSRRIGNRTSYMSEDDSVESEEESAGANKKKRWAERGRRWAGSKPASDRMDRRTGQGVERGFHYGGNPGGHLRGC